MENLEIIHVFEMDHSTQLIKKLIGHYKHPDQVHEALLTPQQKLVFKLYKLLEKGDFESFKAAMHNDVVLNLLNYEYVNLGFKVCRFVFGFGSIFLFSYDQLEYRGKEELILWAEHCSAAFDSNSAVHKIDYVSSKDTDPNIVVVHVRESAKLKRFNDHITDVDTIHIFKFRDGLVSEIQHMVNSINAMEKVYDSSSQVQLPHATNFNSFRSADVVSVVIVCRCSL